MTHSPVSTLAEECMKVSLLSLGEQLMTWVLCLQSECLHPLMVANTVTLSPSNMWRLDFLNRLFCRKYCCYAEINRWYMWWFSCMMFHQIFFPQQGYVVYKSPVCGFVLCLLHQLPFQNSVWHSLHISSYTFFWVLLLASKFAFSYYVQVLPVSISIVH